MTGETLADNTNIDQGKATNNGGFKGILKKAAAVALAACTIGTGAGCSDKNKAAKDNKDLRQANNNPAMTDTVERVEYNDKVSSAETLPVVTPYGTEDTSGTKAGEKSETIITRAEKNANGDYDFTTVEIIPRLNSEDYIMNKDQTPSGTPETMYGCMDFSAFCKDLGISPADIHNQTGSQIIIGDISKRGVVIDDNGNLSYYEGGNVVCYYKGGKAQGYTQDGIALCIMDDNQQYSYGSKIHLNNTNIGALEVFLTGLVNDKIPFSQSY